MNLAAVIFDLDGVLIDTETVSKRAWHQAAQEHGFTFTEDLYLKIIGRSMISAREEITREYGGRIDLDGFFEHATYLYVEEMKRDGIQLMNGTLEVLDYLEQTRLRVAIATSTTRIQADRKLGISGLDGRIPTVVTSDEIKRGKPAPDLFLLAAERLGTRAEDCMVIEDAEPGIIGAHAAGMLPVMVPSTVGPSEAGRKLCHAVLDTLHEAIDIIRELTNSIDSAPSNT